jgi:hypothetical protein
MKIKDEEELARLLSRAFRTYSNQVENGAVAPFKDFIEGKTVVTVTVTLNDDGSINVKDIPEPKLIIMHTLTDEQMKISGAREPDFETPEEVAVRTGATFVLDAETNKESEMT